MDTETVTEIRYYSPGEHDDGYVIIARADVSQHKVQKAKDEDQHGGVTLVDETGDTHWMPWEHVRMVATLMLRAADRFAPPADGRGEGGT
jgi:hypothetical protein